MKTQFISLAALAALAAANQLSAQQTSWPQGESWKKFTATVDGASRDLYIAGTSWSEIGNDSSPATPGDYIYSGSCGGNYGFCDQNCTECDWSWSRSGTWDDASAACRCRPTPAPYVPSDHFEIGFNARVYLTESQTWDPNAYFSPKLLGGSMEYDVDLSQATCGCNAALYMISMPGIGANGQPFPSEDGMHYCDAGKVGGNYCPEFDIMEANVHAYRAVEHACNEPDANGHFNWCDPYGQCHVDILTDEPHSGKPVYGPGSNF